MNPPLAGPAPSCGRLASSGSRDIGKGFCAPIRMQGISTSPHLCGPASRQTWRPGTGGDKPATLPSAADLQAVVRRTFSSGKRPGKSRGQHRPREAHRARIRAGKRSRSRLFSAHVGHALCGRPTNSDSLFGAGEQRATLPILCASRRAGRTESINASS